MSLEKILSNFLSLTVDAVAVSYRDDETETPRFVWANQPFCEMFGISQDEYVGRHTQMMHHPDYRADFRQWVDETVAAGKDSLALDTLCQRKDGESFWASLTMFMVREGDGRHAAFVVRNIDELKNREQNAELALIERERLFLKLEAAQTRLVSALETIPDPFVMFDRKLRLAIWNPSYADTVTSAPEDLQAGMKALEVLKLGLRDNKFPEATGNEEVWLDKAIEDLKRDAGGEPELVDAGGKHYQLIRNKTPVGDRLLFRTDITEIVRQQRELEKYAAQLENANTEISHQATHDELTGLGNRRYLGGRLEEFISWRERHGDEIALLHIDLDRFKQINDTMGHAAGDFVLAEVATRLRRIMRKSDVIARIGGDEFITLMRCEADSKAPEMLANRLVDALSRPLMFEGRQCRFGASVGVARTPLVGPEDLMTSSDIALYRAKEGGRCQVVSFEAQDLVKLNQNKQLTSEIARALENSEFVPFYQPQVDCKTLEIVGFETLARWQHPERGLLAPGDFLATAAEMRVDGQIDSMIFEKAIGDFRSIYDDDTTLPDLSFNASFQRIMDPNLIEDAGRLQDYPGRVVIELLEATFFEEESDEFLMRIDTLRDYGLSFEVDNFGSGRASIVALKRIAPERLKIDRRLVHPITDTDSARKLVRSIVDIGHALEIGVTAEGVESAAHMRILQDFGCDRLQGYHFARPMSFDDVQALLSLEAPFSATA